MFANVNGKLKWAALVLIGVIIALFTAFGPLEKTLGVNVRLVYLHGAWVWAALAGIMVGGLYGLAGLLTQNRGLHAWSRARARTGLLMWLLFLPQSLFVMQANWNGLFLDEPRFRIPLNLAIVGLLLQIGLAFFPAGAWTSLGNLGFAAVVLWGMSGLQTVLHPESPIFSSDARGIQIFFFGLVVLLLLLAWQIAGLLRGLEK